MQSAQRAEAGYPGDVQSTLVQVAYQLQLPPEEFKVWSQNLGHESILTTHSSYGPVTAYRQAEIMRRIPTSGAEGAKPRKRSAPSGFVQPKARAEDIKLVAFRRPELLIHEYIDAGEGSLGAASIRKNKIPPKSRRHRDRGVNGPHLHCLRAGSNHADRKFEVVVDNIMPRWSVPGLLV